MMKGWRNEEIKERKGRQRASFETWKAIERLVGSQTETWGKG